MVEQHFTRALDTAKAQGSKALELRATISLGRLRARLGRRTDTGEKLSRLCKSFTESFATPDLREAKTFLAELQIG
jgi:predicted ATPase